MAVWIVFSQGVILALQSYQKHIATRRYILPNPSELNDNYHCMGCLSLVMLVFVVIYDIITQNTNEITHSDNAINSSTPWATFMRQWIGSSLVQIMACRLFGAKPLSEPMLVYCQLDSWKQFLMKFESEFYHFHSRICIWKCRLP